MRLPTLTGSGHVADLQRELDHIASYQQRFGTGVATSLTDFLAAVGERAGVRGDTLGNPLGGIDVLTQFGLSDAITDVVSHGAERFGTLQDIKRTLSPAWKPPRFAMAHPPPTKKQVWHPQLSTGYDDGGELGTIAQHCGGIGAAAICRTMRMTGTPPSSLHYFSLDDQPPEDGQHAVITFIMNGTERRWWYVSATVGRDTINSDNVSQLFSALPLQTWLLKGCYTQWDKGLARKEYIDLLLAPARRSGVQVVADWQKKSGQYEQRPIWRTPPDTLHAHEFGNFVFGYGEQIDYGPGLNLIDEHDSRFVNAVFTHARRSLRRR